MNNTDSTLVPAKIEQFLFLIRYPTVSLIVKSANSRVGDRGKKIIYAER